MSRPAFGWAAQYATGAGSATLSFTNFPYVPAAVLLEVVLWAALALALLGRPCRARRTRGPVTRVRPSTPPVRSRSRRGRGRRP